MKSIKPSMNEMDRIFSRLPKDNNELQQLMQGIAKSGDGEESCLEKRVYYRLISGKDGILEQSFLHLSTLVPKCWRRIAIVYAF